MIENKELYSYIIGSLEIMNKSIIAGEQNTVTLFTYVYNNQKNIYNKIDDLYNKYNDIDPNLENTILKNNKVINKIIDENNSCLNKQILELQSKIQQLEKQLDEQIYNTIITPVVIEGEKESFIKKMFKTIKEFCVKCYKACYKIIFKKKIQRQLEEKRQIQENLIKKQEEIKNKQYKRRIKDILNIRNEQ